MDDLHKIVARAPAGSTVFYCVWPAPLLTIGKGSYLTDVITACGGTSISATLSADYPHFSIEKLMLANPDVVVMPYEVKDRSFLKKHPWVTLKAVKTDHVFFLPEPKEDGLARPTLRLTKGIFWLAPKLHPELTKELHDWYVASNASFERH
jgi:vitamin B12 transport system substrate-binding protein